MPDDLPDISQDLDAPLPQVPPDSRLVPYRTARRLPGQAPIVTTGYGPRAQRQPLMPPSGTPGIPDTSQMMRTAFEHLPVDQALKVINAVQQSMGQRLFAKAVQGGMPMPQAFATYGRMMFAGQNMGTSGFTGPPQMTPYQQQEIGLRRAAAEASARKASEPKLHFGQGGEIVQEIPGGTYNVLRKPTAKTTAATVTLEPQAGSDEQGTIRGPITDPAIQERLKSRKERTTKKGSSEFAKNAGNMIRGMFGMPYKSAATNAPTPAAVAPPPTTPVTTPPTIERVKVIGPEGKKGTVPKGTTLPEGWKLAE